MAAARRQAHLVRPAFGDRNRGAGGTLGLEADENRAAASVASPRYLPATELSHGIDYRKRNGLDASEYEEHYWGRWFYPLNVLVLCLAAVPFAFGSLRSGGLGKRLFIGIVFALGFWLVQTQFVSWPACSSSISASPT